MITILEFANSRAMRASVVYLPTCQRVSVSKACQLLIFTCQSPNVPPTCQTRANYSPWRANVLTCKRRANYSILCANVPEGVSIFWLSLPKGVPVFQLFFKRIFQFLNFSVMLNICIANFKNIWAILENLSRGTKNLNFDIFEGKTLST